MLYQDLRQEVLNTTLNLHKNGVIPLTYGNISARADMDHFVITPTSIPYEGMKPEDIVVVDMLGNVVEGHYRPSSETPMHRMIYVERSDVGAVIHTHAPYATALAIVGRSIPICSVEGLDLGFVVPVTEYAPPGTNEIGCEAIRTLSGPPIVTSVLLKNHGTLSIGLNLYQTYVTAFTTEVAAQHYYLALQVGEPILIVERDTNTPAYSQNN
ncbi:MAG TPA: class II aldolase/adducin family protein [Desulfitobacteriaceae bacterium]|nr:class II aldolase/adducin family protein [Desulfitobacteriaceae bacterium]